MSYGYTRKDFYLHTRNRYIEQKTGNYRPKISKNTDATIRVHVFIALYNPETWKKIVILPQSLLRGYT